MPSTQNHDSLTTASSLQEHERCWQLLPWLSNGRLEGAQLDGVLDHLKICELCRQELGFLPELRFAVENALLDDEDLSQAQRGHQQVLQRIEAYEQQAPSRPPGQLDPNRWAAWLRGLRAQILPDQGRPRWTVPVLAAQGLLIAVLAFGWTSSVVDSRAGTFQTLSSQTKSSPSNDTAAEGDLLRLVFRAETTEAGLRQLLLASEAELVAGPSPRGVYTVRLPDGRGPSAVETLRRSALVDFAAPVAQ